MELKNNFHLKQRRHKPLQIMAKRGRGGTRGGLKRKPGELDSVVADEPVEVSLERGPNKHPRSAKAGSAKTCVGALRGHCNVEEPSLGIIIEASAVSFQVLDDTGRLLDDEVVSERKSKCVGNQGSRVHKIAPVVSSQCGVGCLHAATSFDASLLGSLGGSDCETHSIPLKATVANESGGSIPTDAPPRDMGPFKASLISEFVSKDDHATVSVLEDFFSTFIVHGSENVIQGLLKLSQGMNQAVSSYATVCNYLAVANARFEQYCNQQFAINQMNVEVIAENARLKVWFNFMPVCIVSIDKHARSRLVRLKWRCRRFVKVSMKPVL